MAQVITDERTYWLDKLGGEPPNVTFPYDCGSARVKSRARVTISRLLPHRLTERLLWVSNGSDRRLLTILISAVGLLLRKYSGSQDVVICTTIFSQQSDGPFINTLLPLRRYVEGGARFKDVLFDFHEELKEAVRNQNFPTKALAYDLNFPTPEDGPGLFNVLVILENIQDPKYAAQVTPDIMFLFRMDSEGLSLDAAYNSSLYTSATVERIITHLEALLEQILFDVNIEVREIVLGPVPSAASRAGREAAPVMSPDSLVSIPEAFDGAAAQFHDRVAVADEATSLSYRQLAAQAEALADRLVRRGVAADHVVGLVAGRSVEMVVGILGILKAGGAYLPVDPSAPPSRALSVLEAAGARVVVISEKVAGEPLVASLTAEFGGDGAGPQGRLLVIENTEPGDEPVGGNSYRSTRSDLAYVIYTSGSTASPKGVFIEHRSVVNLAAWLGAEIFGGGASPRRVALVAPYTFDASVKQIFGALLNGHSLYIPPNGARTDPRLMFDFLKSHQIEILDGTPTHLQYWAPLIKRGELPDSVRQIVIGGEPLPWRLAAELLDLPGQSGMVLLNVYGPTECCDVTTFYEVSADKVNLHSTVPLGKPVPNCDVHVIDLDGKLAPIGVTGEICISGEGIGRGYITAESPVLRELVERPLGVGVPVYRSGDLGRWLPDMNLEFLGRKDQQIKFMGHRIEPREIEDAMLRVEMVSEAVVIGHEEKNGHKSLRAYYVAGPAPELWSERGAESNSPFMSKSLAEFDPADFDFWREMSWALSPLQQGFRVAGKSCVRLLEELAASDGDAPALAAGHLNLRRLNEAANRAARLIVNEGDDRRTRASRVDGTVLCISESAEAQTIAMFAAFKAGKTFAPLKPSYPAECFTRVIKQEAVSTILTDDRSLPLLTEMLPLCHGADLRLINVLKTPPEIPSDNFNVPFRPGQPAYKIYGSPRVSVSPQYLKWRLSELLPAYMIPTSLTPLSSLPVSPNGKLVRSKLPEPAIDAQPGYAPPQGALEEKLAGIWSRVLGVDLHVIGRFSSFLNLGGNSLIATLMLLEIENAFGLEIPLGEMFQKPTLAEMAEFLEGVAGQGRTTHDPNLILIKSRGREAQSIFVVHDGYGWVESYTHLCGKDTPFNLWGIRPEGAERISPHNLTVEALASLYADKVTRMQGDGTYFLAGWSLGGLICYEVARQLEASGRRVGFVGLIDAAAPSRSASTNGTAFSAASEARWVRGLFPELDGRFEDCADAEELWSLTLGLLDSSGLDTREVLHRMIHDTGLNAWELPRVRSYRSIVASINFNRSLLYAQKHYYPNTPVSCDLNFFAADGSRGKFDADWSRLTKGRVNRHQIPGDHFSMMKRPHVEELSRLFVESALRAAE